MAGMTGPHDHYQPGPRVCERALVWHLGHLRLRRQAALTTAAQEARAVFPLVVADPRDPMVALPGYASAVQALARDYLQLGVRLTYLTGHSDEQVVAAARDARADYVYLLPRHDAAGQYILNTTVEELRLWGFMVAVVDEASVEPPAALSGHPLPSQPLPEAAPWGETELLATNAWEPQVLLTACQLGLISRAALSERHPTEVANG